MPESRAAEAEADNTVAAAGMAAEEAPARNKTRFVVGTAAAAAAAAEDSRAELSAAVAGSRPAAVAADTAGAPRIPTRADSRAAAVTVAGVALEPGLALLESLEQLWPCSPDTRHTMGVLRARTAGKST